MNHPARRFSSIRSLLVAAALACASALTLETGTAHACGGYGAMKSFQVRRAVQGHFAAVARGDAARLAALWDPDAKILSVSDADTFLPVRRSETVKSAIARWTEHGKDLRHTLESVKVEGDRATVRARVTFAGGTYDDVLTLARKKAGEWVLVGKTSMLVRGLRATSPTKIY
jgi:ketosteroid isomerase-like protein